MSNIIYQTASASPGYNTINKYENSNQRKKKVGWFTRWFDRKCKESWERARETIELDNFSKTSTPSSMQRLDSAGLSLTIYAADGGTILEFKNLNVKQDRWEHNLHVIGQNENFEERVAQAISMEMLRQGMTK